MENYKLKFIIRVRLRFGRPGEFLKFLFERKIFYQNQWTDDNNF